MSKTKEIVISHYKEDLSWLNVVPPDYKITVYNKHEGDNLLPNVGREAHTYLTHIVNNYESGLSDITVFVQGNPIHLHNKSLFLDEFNHLLSNVESVIDDDKYLPVSEGVIMCDVNGRPHCGHTHMPIGKLYRWLTGKSPPSVFRSFPGAQFCVTKNRILTVEKKMYEKLLISTSYDNNPIEAHCIERMWPLIFGFGIDERYTHNHLNYEGDEVVLEENYLKKHVLSDGTLEFLGNLGEYANGN